MKKEKLAAVFCAATLVLSCLAGCDSGTKAAPATEKPKTNKELFAQGVVGAINDMTKLSGTLGSLNFEALLNPDSAFDPTKSSDTEYAVTLSNAESSSSIVQSTLYDGNTGDTSCVTEVKSGEESYGTSGWYFVGNDLFITRKDAESPMIHHTMTDTSGMKTAMAYERFDMLLCGRDSKLTEVQWNDGAAAYAASLSFTTDAAYSVQEMKQSLAKTEHDVTAYTLTLSGQDAYTALSGLLDLLASDSSYATYLSDIKATLTALDETGKAGLSLVFTVYTASGDAVGTAIDATLADGSAMALYTTNYSDGHIRDNKISMKTFSGTEFSAAEQNCLVSGSNYEAAITYHLNDLKNVMKEDLSITGSGTIPEDGTLSYQMDMNYSVSATNEGETQQYVVSGPLNYTSSGSESGTETTVSAAPLSITMDGEAQSINVDIRITQSFAPVTITPPEFIEAVGVTTTTPAELYAALDLGDDYTSFSQTPQTLRMVIFSIAA